MAEEVGHQKKDLSDDVPKVVGNDINKTLPSPPVSPSLLSLPTGTDRPRINAVFATKRNRPAHMPANEAPPTPMLTAVTPVRFPRADVGLGVDLGKGKSESGLDALERRLLAEVGTRKVDNNDKRPDVRTVLPIAIPSPAVDALNDSAISSLTLADHEHEHDRDSDERTHQPGKHSPSEPDEDMGRPHRRVPATTDGEGSGRKRERNGERRNGRKKERPRDSDAHRRRKSAKGRVAAWLGGIDPDVPPLPSSFSPTVEGSEHLISTAVAGLRKETSTEPASATMGNVSPEQDKAAAPNPRSSGFVPIGTLRRDEVRRQSGTKERSHAREPAADANGLALADSSRPVPQSPQVDRVVSRSSDTSGAQANNPQLPMRFPAKKAEAVFPKASPRLPTFPPTPPTPDPEVKYDIRSARGGRGGRVAAVTSMWASQTGDNGDVKPTPAAQKTRNDLPIKSKPIKASPKMSPSTSATPSPDLSLADLTSRRARLVKSRSVPAAISSSHATPMLSSTASLARPVPLPDRRKTPIKLPPTISESQPALSPTSPRLATATSPQSSAKDLAFGQARLRDLIKKYQGQPTS